MRYWTHGVDKLDLNLLFSITFVYINYVLVLHWKFDWKSWSPLISFVKKKCKSAFFHKNSALKIVISAIYDIEYIFLCKFSYTYKSKTTYYLFTSCTFEYIWGPSGTFLSLANFKEELPICMQLICTLNFAW